mmetsp:Transcript_8347/g.18280  ORF Transcript_8347/g.18280 Transcript_8347/m.18280 type:complete len:199 (-) Transcript_8347:110-706(-)
MGATAGKGGQQQAPGPPEATAGAATSSAAVALASRGEEEGEAEDEEEEEAVPDPDQQRKAKQMVTAFVKQMVRGRRMTVVTHSGKHKTILLSLSRGLDALTVKAGDQARRILLADVCGIHAGEEAEGVSTPVDELCATLVLASKDTVSFRFPDLEARDTFVMCVLMFVQRQQEEAGEGGSQVDDDEDGDLDDLFCTRR